VTGHIERNAELIAVPAKERASQDEMGRARNGKELGESLNDPKNGRLNEHHLVAIAAGDAGPRFARTGSSGAGSERPNLVEGRQAYQDARALRAFDRERDVGVGGVAEAGVWTVVARAAAFRWLSMMAIAAAMKIVE
jgi:hypothetical protein